jgi:hypothetical protein
LLRVGFHHRRVGVKGFRVQGSGSRSQEVGYVRTITYS